MGSSLRLLSLLSLLAVAACSGEDGGDRGQGDVAAPPDRDTWWNDATRLAGGGERVLAPRELRALLADGRRLGFDDDAQWWERRAGWAAERILALDPEDLEANELAGRRTLQSIEGFADVWRRMIETRVPSETMIELFDRYGPWVEEGRPVFLTAEEFALERARFGQAAAHLDRLDADPSYASEQRLLQQVKTSIHGDFPFVHVRAGPFLVFYAARDLQRDPEADPAEEDQRLASRREYHLLRASKWTPVYEEVVADFRALYPEVFARHPLEADVLFPQWVFSERGWYEDFAARVRRGEEDAPYRYGFLHAVTGWAYLTEGPEDADPAYFRETVAYLAALQILRHWARDAEDPTVNHWDRSEAYWFKEGLPSFLASRRVETPVEGRVFAGPWQLPRLTSVIERRGRRGPHGAYLTLPEDVPLEGVVPADGGYTDLAWLVVRQLSEDARREAFQRFLLSQVEGTHKGIEWFEECFGVAGTPAWRALEREIYSAIE